MNAPLAWAALGITLVVIVAYEAWLAGLGGWSCTETTDAARACDAARRMVRRRRRAECVRSVGGSNAAQCIDVRDDDGIHRSAGVDGHPRADRALSALVVGRRLYGCDDAAGGAGVGAPCLAPRLAVRFNHGRALLQPRRLHSRDTGRIRGARDGAPRAVRTCAGPIYCAAGVCASSSSWRP